jgi:hypothetical protein
MCTMLPRGRGMSALAALTTRLRSLADTDYVYVLVDGVHFRVRLEEDRLCTLVTIGVRADGTKELVAEEDGYREGTESWATVLRDLKRRGIRSPRRRRQQRARLLGRRRERVIRDARAARLGAPISERAPQAPEAAGAQNQIGATRSWRRRRARRPKPASTRSPPSTTRSIRTPSHRCVANRRSC